MMRDAFMVPLLALIVTACGTTAPTTPTPSAEPATPAPTAAPSPTAPAGGPDLQFVVIGDSIPFAGHFCPGCTGFVAQYAQMLEQRTGRRVIVENLSRDDSAGMNQIKDEVQYAQDTRDALADADIILVVVGANNAFPDDENRPLGDPAGPLGCYELRDPRVSDRFLSWVLGLSRDCLQTIVDGWGKTYDTIYSTVRELRAGQPTAFLAMNSVDGNIDNSEIRQILNGDEALIAALETQTVLAYDLWNEMECRHAQANGFTCVDIYHAYNGADGSQAPGELSIDGTHPSQKGHDLFARMLAGVDVSVVAP